jgi:hypothetical protein
MKNKETPEEAAERLWNTSGNVGIVSKNSFIKGAKWQAEQFFKDEAIQTLEKGIELLLKKQERMYSEEEVISLLNDFAQHLIFNKNSSLNIIEWFEQFKKK